MKPNKRTAKQSRSKKFPGGFRTQAEFNLWMNANIAGMAERIKKIESDIVTVMSYHDARVAMDQRRADEIEEKLDVLEKSIAANIDATVPRWWTKLFFR